VRHRNVAFDEVGARAQLVSVANRGRVDLRRRENDDRQPRMVSANPGQQVEARFLALVEHEIEQDARDPFPLKQIHGVRRRRRHQGVVAKVVKVNAKLLLHRGFVLHHEHDRPQHLCRPVDLEARRERRQAHLPGAASGDRGGAWNFQLVIYTILNKDSCDMNNQI